MHDMISKSKKYKIMLLHISDHKILKAYYKSKTLCKLL